MKKILASVLAFVLVSMMAVSSFAYVIPSPGSWCTDERGPQVPPQPEKPAPKPEEKPAEPVPAPKETTVQGTSDGVIVVTVGDKDKDEGKVTVPVTVPEGTTVIITGLDDTPIVVTLPVDGADDRTVVVTSDGVILDVTATDDGLVFAIPGDTELKVCDAGDLFEDIADHWAEDAIAKIVALRLMIGYPDGKFHPEDGLSAAMVYTVLARIANAPIETTGDGWIANVTAWADAEGISDGSDPEAEVTRDQLAGMMARAAGAEGDPIEWATASGLLVGDENGDLMLDKNLTRAEFATVLVRYLGK